MITLSALAEIAQLISSAAVVGSLIFVGVQLHQNTKGMRAQSHHAITQELNRINLVWARDKDAARIWLAGIEDRLKLTPEDRWRFDSLARAYLHVCGTMYTQAALGAGDRDIVAAEEPGLRLVFASPGIRSWWAENLFGFSEPFRRYIETTMMPGEAL